MCEGRMKSWIPGHTLVVEQFLWKNSTEEIYAPQMEICLYGSVLEDVLSNRRNQREEHQEIRQDKIDPLEYLEHSRESSEYRLHCCFVQI